MNVFLPRIVRPLFKITCGVLLASTAASQAEVDHDDPAAELASFTLPEGFEANLFASEKDGVVKPIQIRWDSRGRLWVLGSTTYPQLKPGEEPNDKIVILEDTKHTGHADKTTVFADGLMIPTGLELGDGGAYVGQGTKLLFLKDTDGDDHADEKRVVLRGFGTGDNHQNINSFRWSPGGELFFSQGLHGFARVETPYGIVGLDEAGLWRLRPRELRLDPFYGGSADPQNPWGFAWTEWGMPLVVAGNNGGISFPLPEMVRGRKIGSRQNIWVNARSRKSSGPEIIRSAQFPPEWQGVMLSGGYINNAVWALKIEDDGAGFRITDLPPFITSTHGSFRPVDVKLGPDGAIYLCDWYNPIIGHYQASFRHPDRDKVHGRIWRITYKGRPLNTPPPIAGASVAGLLENLKSTDEWTLYQTKRELGARPTAEVIVALEKWIAPMQGRGIATERALYEALGVFEWHESPEPALLARLLAAAQPGVRAYAAGVVARWADRLSTGPDALALLTPLVSDENPRVRLAAVVALANIPRAESLPLALRVIARGTDSFTDLALRQAVFALKPHWLPALKAGRLGIEDKPALLAFLAKADATEDTLGALRGLVFKGQSQPPFRLAAEIPLASQPLLAVMASVGNADDLAGLLTPFHFADAKAGESARDAALRDVLAAVADNCTARKLRPSGNVASAVRGLWDSAQPGARAGAALLAGALKIDAMRAPLSETIEKGAPELRAFAVRGISGLGGRDVPALLAKLAANGEPFSVREAAVRGLSRTALPRAAEVIAASLASETDDAHIRALCIAMFDRNGGVDALAVALKAAHPPAVSAHHMLDVLNNSGQSRPKIADVLRGLAGLDSSLPAGDPAFVAALVAEVREKGDAKRGREIFRRAELACTGCHRIGDEGGTIGPALDAIGSGQPVDFIIGAVLQPQKEIKEGYEAMEVTTKDGRVITGYRVSDDGNLVIRDIATGGQTRLAREEIASRKLTGSLMPSGLVDRLSREDLRDLFRYLSGLGKDR
ncbi:MAG: PVC-type heme-binding CxxCH protein [Chthoniobacteraceae bacterium]